MSWDPRRRYTHSQCVLLPLTPLSATTGTAASSVGPKDITVTLKLAMDQQGAVDDLSNNSYRFTSPESLDAVHRLRRACDAVLVGVNTVIRDDPRLTVRRVPLAPRHCQPLRVVLHKLDRPSIAAAITVSTAADAAAAACIAGIHRRRLAVSRRAGLFSGVRMGRV